MKHVSREHSLKIVNRLDFLEVFQMMSNRLIGTDHSLQNFSYSGDRKKEREREKSKKKKKIFYTEIITDMHEKHVNCNISGGPLLAK